MNINPPSDPVIKKRVSITGNSSPIKWAVISLLSVAGLVGAIYYFYPNLFQNLDDSSQARSGYEYESSEIAQSLAFTNEVAPTVAETPKSPASEPLPDKPKPVDIKTISTPPAKPVAAESTTTQSTLAPTESTAVESPTTQSTLVPTKPVAAESPTTQSTLAPEPSTEPTDPVERLLKKAKRQLARTRFTSPKGDNAYETYQELSKLDPQSAQQVLDGIVAWYFKQGKKYLNRGRLTQPRRANAYKMYQKLREIAPEHKSTQELLNEIVNTLFQRAEQHLEKDNLTTPKAKNAYAIYQKMLTVEPQSEKAQSILESIVQRLLTRANRQMTKQSYTTPKDDNAVDTYRQILKISPNHTEAQNGLNEIANRYYKLATIKKRQARYKESMKWIKKGLQVQPDNPELNQLKQEVVEKLY